MHVTGIVCEYNPFHNGHEYHIEKAKELTNADVMIGVMSGNFVQRGEPAICDKWIRAKTAVEHGVDIIFELPFPYVMQSADAFAKGAIDSLALAGVDDIVFGSEINDVSMLKRIANIDTSSFQDLMKEGMSPIKAYELIYGTLNPNDILGLSYIKAMKHSDIIPLSIKRTNAYHSEELDDHFASASAIRKAVRDHKDISNYTCMQNLTNTHSLHLYYPLIQHLLFTLPKSELSQIFLMDEGLEAHLIKQAAAYMKFDEFLNAATSKRYTTSRIRRTLIHLLMHNTKEDIDTLGDLQHLRLLACNQKGRDYIKTLKAKEVIIASRFNQIPIAWRNIDSKAARLYAWGMDDSIRKGEIEKEFAAPIQVKSWM